MNDENEAHVSSSRIRGIIAIDDLVFGLPLGIDIIFEKKSCKKSSCYELQFV
jgi:hypothetical protein